MRVPVPASAWGLVAALAASSVALSATPTAEAAPFSPVTFGVGKSQIVITPTNETELLSYASVAPQGSGSAVTFFWITGDPVGNGPQAGVDFVTWRFYVDGETTASVVLQTSQAALIGNADPSAPWSTDFSGKQSKFGGWHINLPVPFTASVRVTLQLPPWWAGTERIFAMVRGVDGTPALLAGWALPPTARLTASVVNATLKPLDFHTLVNVSKGTAGLLYAAMYDIRMYGAGAGSLNTLEGCHHVYSPPDAPYPGTYLLGTGAEDYPESAYYFNAGPYRNPTSGLSVFSPSSDLSLVSFYKIHSRDRVFFNDGLAFQWRNGDVTDRATGQKCIAVDGEVIGTPSMANVSTLAYVYTW